MQNKLYEKFYSYLWFKYQFYFEEFHLILEQGEYRIVRHNEKELLNVGGVTRENPEGPIFSFI